MLVRFEDLKVQEPRDLPGRGNPYPLEITLDSAAKICRLQRGVEISVPSDQRPARLNGLTLVGYLVGKDSEAIDISFTRIDNYEQQHEFGGVRIYSEAIRRMKKLDNISKK